ncbi:MAG: type II secretion system minor pseudopilin GspH [Pseudomonadota bacterium]
MTKSRARGFTLVEILVVITLVAILTSMVIVNFTGADQRQRHEGAVERLALRFDLARQRAVQRNRELGFNLDLNAYEFVELDREANAWRVLEARPLGPGSVERDVVLQLVVEGSENLDDDRGSEDREVGDGLTLAPPDLVFFRSGEVMPFQLSYTLADSGQGWVISSDGLSSIGMGPAGTDDEE